MTRHERRIRNFTMSAAFFMLAVVLISVLGRARLAQIGDPLHRSATAVEAQIVDAERLKLQYAFGRGLSSTAFDYRNLKVSGGQTITATFAVTNTGTVAGADVPQLYLTGAPNGRRTRLLGFERVELKPGESRTVTVTADPHRLAEFENDNGPGQWRIAGGAYRVALGRSPVKPVLAANATLTARVLDQ